MTVVLVRWVEVVYLLVRLMQHPLDVSYGGVSGWYFLLILGIVSIGFFIFQVQKATRLVLLGSKDNRLSLIHI